MIRPIGKAVWLTGVLAIMLGCEKSEQPGASRTRQLPDWMVEETAVPDDLAGDLFRDAPTAKLDLQLKPGDRFPLRKVVRQELTQSTLTGTPSVSQSELEVMFAITVQEVQAERVKLSVRYDRVRYSHDIAGERVAFDSISAPLEVPVAVRAYRDMIGDGFSFWLGENNQIASVEGFTDFLRRCMRNVPEELRSSVMLGIEATSGEDGIANFVDNSIGLLPPGSARRPGDTWSQPRFVSRPIPMQIENDYTLKNLTAGEAVIEIRGAISPANVGSAQSEGVKVRVVGGSTQGTCTVYRQTGLPRESHVERVVDMIVTMAPVEFRQQKRIVTTIESFPVVSGGQVMQVGFEC